MPSFSQHSKWKLVKRWRHMLALHCILMIIPSQTYCVGPIFVRATICRVVPLGFDQNWPSEVAYVKCVWLTYIKCAWLCEPVIRQQYYGNLDKCYNNPIFFLHVLSTFYFYSYMYWAGRTIKTNTKNLELGKYKNYNLSYIEAF